MSTIRPADLRDIPRLVELGKVMHAESRYRDTPYSPARLYGTLSMLIERPEGCVLVAVQDDEIIGGMAGIISPHWSLEAFLATDLALFVEPGKRGGMAAAMLLKDFIAWAKGNGASLIDIGINTGVRVEETARLFERLGGDRIGYIYSWGPRCV